MHVCICMYVYILRVVLSWLGVMVHLGGRDRWISVSSRQNKTEQNKTELYYLKRKKELTDNSTQNQRGKYKQSAYRESL